MECILILGANLLWHKYNNIPMVQLVHFPQTCATVLTISAWVTKATCSKNSGHFLCKYSTVTNHVLSLSSQNYRSFLIINVVYVNVIILSLKLNYRNLFGFRLLSRSSSRSYESLTPSPHLSRKEKMSNLSNYSHLKTKTIIALSLI